MLMSYKRIHVPKKIIMSVCKLRKKEWYELIQSEASLSPKWGRSDVYYWVHTGTYECGYQGKWDNIIFFMLKDKRDQMNFSRYKEKLFIHLETRIP